MNDKNKDISKVDEDIPVNSYVEAIDHNDVELLKKLINNNNKDIVLEIYNKGLLYPPRLKIIIEKYRDYLYISNLLLKKLMKNNDIFLLNIIFKSLKFYDNELIKKLLFYYQYKKPLSSSDLNKLISNKNYSILTEKDYISANSNSSSVYLFNACSRGKEHLFKYLVGLGANRNKEDRFGQTPLFDACLNGNEILVKYLVEHGADISKENSDGKTAIFNACSSGNVTLVKYLIELGVDNK